ncbi:MAG: FHA domain-containing protein [Polyangiaceae bacterium]
MAPSTPPHDPGANGASGGATLTRDVGTFGAPVRGGPRTRELLIYGESSSFRVALPRVGRVVLGRGESATVDLGDRAASRAHAEVTCDVTGLRIQDLGSHNGTRLNGRPLDGGAGLRRGDTVTIGSTHVVVLTDGDDEERSGTDLHAFRALVREHAARATREAYVFAVIALETDDPAHADLRTLVPLLRPGEVLGTDDGRSALVLVPLEDETIEARAEALAGATGDARVGFAVAPRTR